MSDDRLYAGLSRPQLDLMRESIVRVERRARVRRAWFAALWLAVAFVACRALGWAHVSAPIAIQQQSPPAGHPFGDVRKLAEFGAVMDQCRSWGLQDIETLALIAWALRVNWQPRDGLGPILAVWP